MKRTLSVLLSLCLLCLTCSGCMGEPEQTNESLTIYVNRILEQNPEFRTAMREYNELYPSVQKTIYKLPEDDNAQTALYAELMAGRGPDLILIDQSTFPSIYKTCAAGAFCDLQPFLNADPDYDPADFYAGVLEAGQFDGRQLLFPLQLRMRFSLTTERLADEMDFSIENCASQQGYRQELLSVLLKHPEMIPIWFEREENYLHFLGIGLLNFKTDTVQLDSPVFRELSRNIQEYRSLCPENPRESAGWEKYMEGAADALTEGRCLTANEMAAILGIAAILTEKGETPVLIPPRDTDGKVHAEVTLAAGISNQSHNRQNAYEFLKLFTQIGDEEEGEEASVPDYDIMWPARKSLLENHVEMLRKSMRAGNLFGKEDLPFSNSPAADPGDSFFEDFYAAFDSIGHATFYNPGVEKAYEYMLPYLEGEASLDECVKKAQDYLEVYLSE